MIYYVHNKDLTELRHPSLYATIEEQFDSGGGHKERTTRVFTDAKDILAAFHFAFDRGILGTRFVLASLTCCLGRGTKCNTCKALAALGFKELARQQNTLWRAGHTVRLLLLDRQQPSLPTVKVAKWAPRWSKGGEWEKKRGVDQHYSKYGSASSCGLLVCTDTKVTALDRTDPLSIWQFGPNGPNAAQRKFLKNYEWWKAVDTEVAQFWVRGDEPPKEKRDA